MSAEGKKSFDGTNEGGEFSHSPLIPLGPLLLPAFQWPNNPFFGNANTKITFPPPSYWRMNIYGKQRKKLSVRGPLKWPIRIISCASKYPIVLHFHFENRTRAALMANMLFFFVLMCCADIHPRYNCAKGEGRITHPIHTVVRTRTYIQTKMDPIDQVCSPFIGTIMLHFETKRASVRTEGACASENRDCARRS